MGDLLKTIMDSIHFDEGVAVGGAVETPVAPVEGAVENPQELTNTNTGGLDQITGELPEGIVKNDNIEPNGLNEDAPVDRPEGETSLDDFDDLFDWGDGEKDALNEKLAQANVTPEQMGIFKDLTGDIVGMVAEAQEQTEKLQDFIKKDFQAEAGKLSEAGWSKADVTDIIDFAGSYLGEGGAEKLAGSINNADVLFVLKAMKDKMVGNDNGLEQKHSDKEGVYSQADFLRDQEGYRDLKNKGGSRAELDTLLQKTYDKVRRLGDEKLKEDLKHIL